MASLTWEEEVFYRRLMSVVDDYGRVEANPQLLRARCYPLQTDRVRAADISRCLSKCAASGLILCYADGSKQYLEVLNFQQPQRSASKCPAPPATAPPLNASESICMQPKADAAVFVSDSECVSDSVSEFGKKSRKRATPTDRPEDVAEQIWSDWTTLRKAKRAPITSTVLDAARTEAGKASMPLEAFLRVWCARGSQGLEASWLKPTERNGGAGEPQWAKERRAEIAAYGGSPRAARQIIDMEDANAREKLG